MHSRAASNSLRRLLIIAVYTAFAAAVYVAHGPKPDINIDHIAYFKLADEIRAAHPHHDYWREITATRSYGVIMAYLFDLTGDHIRTLKVMLALMTVAYLLCMESFLMRFTARRWQAVFFSLASAVHVSLGAAFWGVTDFEASLNRTLAIPPMLLLLGWYFGNFNRHRRLVVYPGLIYLSILHLGTYYMLGVLATMDGVRLVRDLWMRSRDFWPALVAYVAAFALVGAAYVSIQHFNIGSTLLTTLVPRFEHRASAVQFQSSLSSQEAWELEVFAQPWRNFPPPLATLLNAALSLAFIAPLSLVGGLVAVRRGGWGPFDKPMLLMAACVLACAYSLQALLWIIRHWIPVYPINFEEVRTICLIYLPLLYFIMRGFEWAWNRSANTGIRVAAVCGALLLFLQPITLIRMLPRGTREGILSTAQQMGILDMRASQRNTFARRTLGLERDGQRFYYSVLPTLTWLRAHTGAEDRVLTNRDELYLLDAKVLGTSNGFLNTDPRSPVRHAWRRQVLDLDAALSAHDSNRVVRLAHECNADFAVVPWSEPGAAFDDGTFSVIALGRVPQKAPSRTPRATPAL